ncbi:hypothetical protein SJDPG2_06910 [Porphyromonas gingivalis SJD2]|nr:hypothetical protein SJDPG2_06910 [Porphyromonas gingivalis SJD2]
MYSFPRFYKRHPAVNHCRVRFDAFIDVYCCQQRFVRIKYRQGFIFIAIKTEHWVKIFLRTFSYRAKKRCNTEIGFPNYNISMVIDFVVRN